ncbi:MAG: hypothetical protein MUC36_19610 [Planctomycetes bacterium]|jgi:hypothetical protein|nr:hypothetical protein [Planctomycetota bacterium]
MTDPMPDTPSPAPEPPPPAEPFAAGELHALLRHPGHAFELLLAERERLAATVAGVAPPWTLCLVLLLATALAAVPYGLAQGGSAWWKIAALFGGSTLLCWPSLQVFGAYLGIRRGPANSLALALVIAAVASLFTLGLAPICWFLQLTMQNGDLIDAGTASRGMLALAALAGLLQLGLCTSTNGDLRALRSRGLLLLWSALLLFVTVRMARAIELFA